MKNFGPKVLFVIVAILSFKVGYSQEPKQKSEFWKKVQFGGGLGLGFGNGNANIMVAPSAIYNFNEKVALGAGLQYSYVRFNNNNIQNGPVLFDVIESYKSSIYGGSIIGLVNPIPEIQLSAELEQLRVNTTFSNPSIRPTNLWNTAMFIGAGYRTNNATIGVRYNILHNENNNVYTTAFLPFVRVFF
jgi:hypothetical protein